MILAAEIWAHLPIFEHLNLFVATPRSPILQGLWVSMIDGGAELDCKLEPLKYFIVAAQLPSRTSDRRCLSQKLNLTLMQLCSRSEHWEAEPKTFNFFWLFYSSIICTKTAERLCFSWSRGFIVDLWQAFASSASSPLLNLQQLESRDWKPHEEEHLSFPFAALFSVEPVPELDQAYWMKNIVPERNAPTDKHFSHCQKLELDQVIVSLIEYDSQIGFAPVLFIPICIWHAQRRLWGRHKGLDNCYDLLHCSRNTQHQNSCTEYKLGYRLLEARNIKERYLDTSAGSS